jgi:hypothetical protein
MARTNGHFGSIVMLTIAGWMGPHAAGTAAVAAPRAPDHFLRYNGSTSYVEVPSASALGVGPAGLTVAVWMRPDALSFPQTEGSRPTEQYVHWLGKGEAGKHEWTFRMYSQTAPPGPRANRISFYVFNLSGGRGCGSYFQDAVVAGQWIHVVGVVNPATHHTAIYKNGELRHEDNYGGIIDPAAGSAPLRFGTKDMASYFDGAIGPVYLWSRALSAAEIRELFGSATVPADGLVAEYATTEGSGTVLHDARHEHDGTVHDAQWGQSGAPIASGGGQSGGGC